MKSTYFTTVLISGIALSVSAVNPASAVEWRPISKGNGATLYIDTDSVKEMDGSVQAWLMVDMDERNPTVGDHSYLLHMRFRCDEDETSLRSTIYYSDRMGGGSVVETERKDSWIYSAVVPGTLGGVMLQEVCALAAP